MFFEGQGFGSVVLFGEYAVAFQKTPAIMMALPQKIHAYFAWRDDHMIQIHSDLDDFSGTWSFLSQQEQWSLLVAMLAYWPQTQSRGWELRLVSDLPIAQGLGSSAALIVAIFTAIEKSYGRSISASQPSLELLVGLLRSMSPKASGADCAAALYGGTIIYDPLTYKVAPLADIGPWYWAYSGYKTTTNAMLQRFSADDRALSKHLLNIAILTEKALESWSVFQIDRLKALMNAHHQIQVALGTFERKMLPVYQNMRQLNPLAGIKISGSGCGDGFIMLGGEPLSLKDFGPSQWGQSLIPATFQGI